MSDKIVYESEARSIDREQRANPRAATGRAAAPVGGERLTRRRRTQDVLAVPKPPPGMSYEWKRESIAGKPDNVNMMDARENHWAPVPAERHPELSSAGDSVIRRGDVILCQRPIYLTEEAQLEDIHLALEPVQKMEEVMFGTKPGEMTRNHPSVRKNSYVRQQYAPGEPITEAGDGLSAEP